MHPRTGSPANALLGTGLPLVAAGGLVVQPHLSISQIFGLFGGFSVLCFLLVYGLVACSSLQVALPGNSRRRRWLVGGTSLLAVAAITVAHLTSVVEQQNDMLITFAVLLLAGALE